VTNKNAIDQALKNIFSDQCWQYVTKRHRYAMIEGVRVGTAFATNSKSQYEDFLLNCADMERLRAGKPAGKLDQMFVVATKTNGAGQAEYRGHTEANALYETKLRHRAPLNGSFGPFWSLGPDEFEGEEMPF
jgi:hypothetical protein